ncbi:MAG: hypothetical protein ACK56G_10835, partial [Pirellulaceae bacterium]
SGDHDVGGGIGKNPFRQLCDRSLLAFRFPGSKAGITETASQIAAAGSKEDRWRTRQESFSLSAVVELADLHKLGRCFAKWGGCSRILEW